MIAGDGEDRAVSASGRAELRASHADREGVIDTLKAAYVHGFVTKDEFDERVGQTLASRTRAELALITADIPADVTVAPPVAGHALATANPPARANSWPDDRAVGVPAVGAALVFIVAFFFHGQVAALIALGATGSALLSMFLAVVHVINSRRDKHSGAQLPPQRAIDTGARTSQNPQINQPRRRRPASAAAARAVRLQPNT